MRYLIIVFFLTAIYLVACKKDRQPAPTSSQFSVSFTEIDNSTFNNYNLKGSLSVLSANGQIEYGFLMGADSNLTINNSTKIIVGKSTQSITFSLSETALDTGKFLYFKAYALQGSSVAYSITRSIAKFTPAITYADSAVNNGYPISVYTNIPNLDSKATVTAFLSGNPVKILANSLVNVNQAAFILSYPTQLSPGDYTLTMQISGFTLTFPKKITLLTGKWQQLSNIPFSYPWLANKTVEGFYDNGWIYQYGWIRDGTLNGTKAQFYRYNIQTQEQKVLTGFDPAGENIILDNPEIDFNGDIHFLGGETIVPDFYSVNTHYVYHTKSDTWTQEPNIPSGPRQDAIGFLYNNKIYFGLGYQVSNFNSEPFVYQKFYNDFYCYDPIAKTWQQLASYPLNSTYFSTSFMIGSKIYVTDGVTSDGSTPVKDTWCYDIQNNTWSKKASFPGRADLYCYNFTIGGYAYVGGGQTATYDSFAGPNYIVQCFRYDPVADKWTEVSNMGVSMSYPICGTQGQTGIVGGGFSDSWQPLNVLYRFTP